MTDWTSVSAQNTTFSPVVVVGATVDSLYVASGYVANGYVDDGFSGSTWFLGTLSAATWTTLNPNSTVWT